MESSPLLAALFSWWQGVLVVVLIALIVVYKKMKSREM
jgi:uncharacterized membrane protein YdcZ (DUF606 family)